jgi:hypothetical protein
MIYYPVPDIDISKIEEAKEQKSDDAGRDRVGSRTVIEAR